MNQNNFHCFGKSSAFSLYLKSMCEWIEDKILYKRWALCVDVQDDDEKVTHSHTQYSTCGTSFWCCIWSAIISNMMNLCIESFRWNACTAWWLAQFWLDFNTTTEKAPTNQWAIQPTAHKKKHTKKTKRKNTHTSETQRWNNKKIKRFVQHAKYEWDEHWSQSKASK